MIVKDVSFEIVPGKITVILGQNGAGKSTLLEALTGKYPVEQGQVEWDDIPLAALDNKAMAVRRAVLSQHNYVAFPITVDALVGMGCYASHEHMLDTKVDGMAQIALRTVEMESFAHRMFSSLSGGEQKRVMLAKCLVQLATGQSPDFNKYLFLDEPTNNLDIQQQLKLITIIKALVKSQNIGVCAILHDLNIAAQFADEILLLKNGSIHALGSPSAVLTPESLHETFGIHTIVSEHPVLTCPQITTLPS
jgi:iron complex transport system ATP-binding protein